MLVPLLCSAPPQCKTPGCTEGKKHMSIRYVCSREKEQWWTTVASLTYLAHLAPWVAHIFPCGSMETEMLLLYGLINSWMECSLTSSTPRVCSLHDPHTFFNSDLVNLISQNQTTRKSNVIVPTEGFYTVPQA